MEEKRYKVGDVVWVSLMEYMLGDSNLFYCGPAKIFRVSVKIVDRHGDYDIVIPIEANGETQYGVRKSEIEYLIEEA